MPILAHVFEDEGALELLEGFTSLFGPAFYGLPVNENTLTLSKTGPADLPDKLITQEGEVTVFDPGFPLLWRVTS